MKEVRYGLEWPRNAQDRVRLSNGGLRKAGRARDASRWVPLMMIRSSRRGRARETARGSADGLIEPMCSEQRLGWSGLGWLGGSLKSSWWAASQQLHSFRGSSTCGFFFFLRWLSNFRTCDVTWDCFSYVAPAMQTKLSENFLPSVQDQAGFGF